MTDHRRESPLTNEEHDALIDEANAMGKSYRDGWRDAINAVRLILDATVEPKEKP